MNYREILEREFSDESEALKAAKMIYPNTSWVYLTESKQYGIVSNCVDSADGVLVQIADIGLVPIAELRTTTAEEMNNYLNK